MHKEEQERKERENTLEEKTNEYLKNSKQYCQEHYQ